MKTFRADRASPWCYDDAVAPDRPISERARFMRIWGRAEPLTNARDAMLAYQVSC